MTPSFSRREVLPKDAELNAMRRGVEFYRRARLMPNAKAAAQLATLYCDEGAATSDNCSEFARNSKGYDHPDGNGALGMFEGYTSDIAMDGTQPRSIG